MYDYGLIGDMSSAALVGTDGSVDWCCLPRFDSPSVFASILDEDIGGRFQIRPSGSCKNTSQAYLPDTNILETTFTTPDGVVKITDFMPIQDSDKDGKPDTNPAVPPELHRIVTCTDGSVTMRCDYEPRHDYARTVPAFNRHRSSGTVVETEGGRQSMMLLSSVAAGERRQRDGGVHPVAGRVGDFRPGIRRRETRNPGTVPHTGKVPANPQILAEPCRRDELRRPVAGSGSAVVLGAAPDDVSRHRGHRRRSDYKPPRDARRVEELGLPLFVAARHELHR